MNKPKRHTEESQSVSKQHASTSSIETHLFAFIPKWVWALCGGLLVVNLTLSEVGIDLGKFINRLTNAYFRITSKEWQNLQCEPKPEYQELPEDFDFPKRHIYLLPSDPRYRREDE